MDGMVTNVKSIGVAAPIADTRLPSTAFREN